MVGGRQCTAGMFSSCHLDMYNTIIFNQYVQAPQESVIGIVLGRSGEGWRVDIGSAHPALLDGLAFEGATKRSKPNLKVRISTCLSFIHSIFCVGWCFSLRPRVPRTQRHGARTGMFRCSNTQSRRFRRA